MTDDGWVDGVDDEEDVDVDVLGPDALDDVVNGGIVVDVLLVLLAVVVVVVLVFTFVVL